MQSQLMEKALKWALASFVAFEFPPESVIEDYEKAMEARKAAAAAPTHHDPAAGDEELTSSQESLAGAGVDVPEYDALRMRRSSQVQAEVAFELTGDQEELDKASGGVRSLLEVCAVPSFAHHLAAPPRDT